jgi:transcriptional regulator with XRE-family HTH domain
LWIFILLASINNLFNYLSIVMSIIETLVAARKASGLRQGQLAEKSGLTRMTVQRIEAQAIDPRLGSVLEIAGALDLEVMAIPRVLRQEVEAFIRSGGRFLSQPTGAAAPPSIIDDLLKNRP